MNNSLVSSEDFAAHLNWKMGGCNAINMKINVTMFIISWDKIQVRFCCMSFLQRLDSMAI